MCYPPMEMAFIEFKKLNTLHLKCGNLGTNNRLVKFLDSLVEVIP